MVEEELSLWDNLGICDVTSSETMEALLGSQNFPGHGWIHLDKVKDKVLLFSILSTINTTIFTTTFAALNIMTLNPNTKTLNELHITR